MKYNQPISKEQLKEYQSMTLDDKIKLSYDIIKEFYENIDDKNSIIISSSFGKDSVVMIDLVRKLYPEIPIGYVNTGVEHPSSVELSKKYDNVLEIQPKKSIKEVIDEYGYMLPLGKEKTNTIALCRKNLYEGNFNTLRLKKMRGEFGEDSLFNFSKWQWVIYAPFKISDKCCHYLKHEPFERFSKKYGFHYAFVGTTAEESRMRKNNIRNNGFITSKQCRPIAHWTVQDVLKYCVENDIEIASSYGEIIEENGKLKTTQFDRNGCTCCPVSSHLKKKNDFQWLYETDRETWDYVINELGFGQVLDYFDIPYTDEKSTNKSNDVQSKLM